MNSKVLVGILFVVTFVVSFVIYLLLVTFINPHLDLSKTAKKDSEMGPSVEQAFQNDSGSRVNLPNSNYTPVSNTTASQNNSAAPNNTTTPNNQQNNDVSTVDNNLTPENTNDNSQEDQNSSSSSDSNTYTPPPPPPVITKTPPPPPSVTIKKNTNSSVNNSINNAAPPKPPIEIKKPLAPFKPDEPNNSKPTLDTNSSPGNSTSIVPKKLNRVIVGSYRSAEEAQKASENIASSNSSLKPVVKNLNGKYTIQVGAFSDRKKAEALANTLNASNQAAAVKSEQ